MEIKYEEKEVSIRTKDAWSYVGVNNETLKDINPELCEKIQAEVTNYVDNKEKIDAEVRAKEKQEKYEAKMKVFNEWKTSFMEQFGDKLRIYNVKFNEPNERTYSYSKNVDIGSFSIEYNGTVVRDGAWHSSKTETDRPWVLCTPDYKTIRYAKLETAVAKCVERVNAYLEEKQSLETRERQAKYEEQVLEEFAADSGFKFDKVYHSSKYGNGYYTFTMIKNNVRVEIRYDKETDTGKIISYRVAKEGITLDEVKKIAGDSE